jgi:hypothetical protein
MISIQKKSSTPGMYNLIKWLGEAKSLGIQMFPILSTLRYFLGIEGETLGKV